MRHRDKYKNLDLCRSERLGHKDISTTLDTYAHVLPGQQRDAARRLAALLHRA